MTARASTFEPWAQVDDLPELPEAVLEATKVDAIQMASDVLFQFTGRQWPGVGTSTLRPCACRCSTRRGCTCAPAAIALPWRPVVAVDEVSIGGDVLDPSEYRVDNDALLVRQRDMDGRARSWPAWQDLAAPLGDDRTFGITYRHGALPPVGGVRSCIQLAEQLARAWTPDQTDGCRLPKRVTTLSRQGVALAVLDPLTLFADGRTGLPEVDLWIGSVMHGAQRRPGAVIDVAGMGGHGRPRFRQTRPSGS